MLSIWWGGLYGVRHTAGDLFRGWVEKTDALGFCFWSSLIDCGSVLGCFWLVTPRATLIKKTSSARELCDPVRRLRMSGTKKGGPENDGS